MRILLASLFLILTAPCSFAAATDDYGQLATGLDSPYRHAAAVTPSDTVDLTNVTRAVYVGGAGNIVYITEQNETVTLTGVTVGTVYRICASRIKSTSTTATNIVALW
ncbi:spike base protein, RCAP_Rcc01079 family [Zavarzinella formosa]|uniref:spike base protein, RCAP_Rcc01079 family n=1 Tax=Zavarzinella formosa TaxID=360055 RepID=UPI000314E3B4|nr:hypothetical protein [Zavarzinella formosa]